MKASVVLFNVIDARYVGSVYRASEIPERLPAPDVREVAFAGKSNVGKSSLINVMVQRKCLVRSGQTPGLTRSLNLFRAVYRGPQGQGYLNLMDLPGYGFAHRSQQERRQWQHVIEKYLSTRVNLTHVVVIVDIRRGVEDDDAQLINYVKTLGPKVVPIATKIDKIPSHRRKPMLLKLKQATQLRWIGFSVPTQEGREDVWNAVLQ